MTLDVAGNRAMAGGAALASTRRVADVAEGANLPSGQRLNKRLFRDLQTPADHPTRAGDTLGLITNNHSEHSLLRLRLNNINIRHVEGCQGSRGKKITAGGLQEAGNRRLATRNIQHPCGLGGSHYLATCPSRSRTISAIFSDASTSR